MAELILYHHVQGRTAGVEAFAERLREAGHEVTVPDLFAGATFDTIDEGVAHVGALGFENLVAAAEAVAEELPDRLVYAGFSLGAMSAHKLAQTRPGALGALLYHHGDVPIETFGETWPAGVDLQIHISEGDDYYEPEIVDEFVERAGVVATAERFVYPGSTHLFTDSSVADYEPVTAAQVMERTLEFLERIA